MFTFAFTDDILFQLTPSRRATMESSSFFMFSSISTHALTEGDEFVLYVEKSMRISTHALTEGDDTEMRC